MKTQAGIRAMPASIPSAGTPSGTGSTPNPPTKGRAYSKGNRQKVALIAALASDVELLCWTSPPPTSVR
jgi:hypothetical protein